MKFLSKRALVEVPVSMVDFPFEGVDCACALKSIKQQIETNTNLKNFDLNIFETILLL